MREGGKRPWRPAPRGLQVAIRLTPKGGRDAIEGIEQRADGTSVLKARVRAAPQDGEANAALRTLLARSIGVPAGSISVVAGAAARTKRVEIEGDPAALAMALENLAGRTAA